jgi:cytochrome c-type biogenesis protein CcmH/NrfG
MTVTKRVVRLDPDSLAVLEEQRSFLRRSLVDLELEHDAGDLDADDYQTLRHDYEKRLASVDRTIDEGKAEFAATRAPRRRGRTALIVTLVLLFAIVCGFGVARSAGRRDVNGTITGDINETARERNTNCLNLAPKNPQGAIGCYTDVLKDAPNNVEALTYRGWIRILNQDTSGLSDLRQAVMTDSTYPDVHAFLAIVLFQTGCVSDAAAELARLDALHPSPLIQQQIDSFGLRDQIKQAQSAPSTTANACGQ